MHPGDRLRGHASGPTQGANGQARQILIVAHGKGRGRDVPSGEMFLQRLGQQDPAFAGTIRIHRTGEGDADLRNVALVMFWLADPLRQRYPDCHAEAVRIAGQARSRGIEILNPPEGLSNTSKSLQARIWARNGIPSARAVIAETAGQLQDAVAEVGFPCIIRSDETHCERHVIIAARAEDARRGASMVRFPASVISLSNVREAYRAADASGTGLLSRYHHKARAFVFRGEVMASHMFFSRDLIVGLSSSTFAREDTPRRELARKFGYRRRILNEMIAKDLGYFDAPVPHAGELVKAVAALGLDFAAVDYCILPDGRPIIWEANPYFYLPGGQKSVFSAQRDAVRRVNQTYDWMAQNLKTAFARACAAGAGTWHPVPAPLKLGAVG